MVRISINRRNAALTALLFLSLMGVCFSSQALNASVSQRTTVYLDANQSIMNFTANATGGTPFPQTSGYNYQWQVQTGTSCPGISPAYQYQIPVLRYSPTGTTSNCVVSVQVSDYLGSTAFASTGKIVVNPSFYASGNLSRSTYNVTQGQNDTLAMSLPTGGTPPYHYQWLAATSVGGILRSSTANALCAVTPNTPTCKAATNYSTAPGIYEFELRYWDSATTPIVRTSQPILIRVQLSSAPTTSTTTVAVENVTTVETTVATTSAVTSLSTTSSVAPTVSANTPKPKTATTIPPNHNPGIIAWLISLFKHL